MNLKHVRSKKLVTTGHMTVWPDIYEVSLVDKFIATESSLVSVSSCENGDTRIWLLMHIVFENIVQVEHEDSCTTPKIQWIKNLEKMNFIIYQFHFHKCFHKYKNQNKKMIPCWPHKILVSQLCTFPHSRKPAHLGYASEYLCIYGE
jgi:hypothetical protein